METVDPADSSPSQSSFLEEDDSSSDYEDFGLVQEDSPKAAVPSKVGLVVPNLSLDGLNRGGASGANAPVQQPQPPPPHHHQQQQQQQLQQLTTTTPRGSPAVVPVSVRSGEVGSTCIAVDLLSNAFRLKQETLQQAREWGWSLEQIVGTGFSSALDVSKRNLHYYVVREVAWEEIAEECPKHIAVGIEGSSFTLGAVEDMLRKNREGQQVLTNQSETLLTYEKDVQRLEMELKSRTEALHSSENENRHLRRQVESLRQAYAQQQQMPSLLSASLVSPRLLSTGGSGSQLRSPSAMARLRDLIAENQQLVTTLERCDHQHHNSIMESVRPDTSSDCDTLRSRHVV